jgi:hypothetical protein
MDILLDLAVVHIYFSPYISACPHDSKGMTDQADQAIWGISPLIGLPSWAALHLNTKVRSALFTP